MAADLTVLLRLILGPKSFIPSHLLTLHRKGFKPQGPFEPGNSHLTRREVGGNDRERLESICDFCMHMMTTHSNGKRKKKKQKQSKCSSSQKRCNNSLQMPSRTKNPRKQKAKHPTTRRGKIAMNPLKRVMGPEGQRHAIRW